MNKRFIITGGIGCGKSTTVQLLEDMGHNVKTEAARKLIQKAKEDSKTPLPWQNRIEFDRLLINELIKDFSAADSGVWYFDRGIPDLIGWAKYSGIPPAIYSDLVVKYRYCEQVFFLENSREIYEENQDRPYSYNEACKISNLVRLGYKKCGYQIVDIECDSPSNRAMKILKLR